MKFEGAALQSCGFGQLMELRQAGFEVDTVTSQRRQALQQIQEALPERLRCRPRLADLR